MRRSGAPGDRGDLFLRLTAAQLLLCALVLLLVWGAMKKNAPLFARMREEFLSMNAADWDPGSLRFFDFGSVGEKRGAAGETEATQAASGTVFPEENGSAAGGADLTAAEAKTALDPAFYDTCTQVVLPVNGTVTSAFGARIHPVYGTEGFHSGKDVAAPEGTPVHAAMDGVVTGAGTGEMSGNYVRLSHENGVETLYCHLRAANVEEGIRVRRGDVIGFVGQTGLATGPHLHFEVIIDGKKRDPDFLLEGASVVF